jgi:hypothetical protein
MIILEIQVLLVFGIVLISTFLICFWYTFPSKNQNSLPSTQQQQQHNEDMKLRTVLDMDIREELAMHQKHKQEEEKLHHKHLIREYALEYKMGILSDM